MDRIDKFQGEYRWLSNFESVDIVFEGVSYPSVEHAYQAAKTLDPLERDRVRTCGSPAKAKALGMTVTLRSDWTEELRIKTMYELNYQKFQRPDLAEKLKNTKNAYLVEGNTWGDIFWGYSSGRGANHLGKILMKIREENNLPKHSVNGAK